MKQCFILFFLFLCHTLLLSGQEMEWGKVDPADFSMITYAADTSAAAVVLLDIGDISLDFSERQSRSVLKRHKQIKVLTTSGLDEGDIIISYNKESQNISEVRVQTISPTGLKTWVDKDNIFTEELEDGWRLKKISAPNVEVGSTIVYEYRLTTNYVTTLPFWYFETDIPTRKSELKVHIPSWMNYIFIVNKPSLLTKNETVSDIEARSIIEDGGTTFSHRHFTAEQLPKIKEEAYVSNIDDHRMNVQFQLSEYAPPFGGYHKFLDTWEVTAKELLDNNNLGKQFLKKSYARKLRAEAIQLVSTLLPKREQVDAVYKFLQNRVAWSGYYRLYAQSKLDDSFIKGQAHSGELNMMALVMLNELGITAEPILLSTRSNGKHITEYPIVQQFNHLIVRVQLDKKELLLDLTNPFRPPGYVSVEALNSKGFVLNEDNPQWIDLVPTKGKDVIAANLTLGKNGQISGEVKTRCSGYSAINERSLLASDPQGKFWQERLNEQFAEVTIDSMKFRKVADLAVPLTSRFKVTIDDAAQAVGDFIYLNPTLYSNFLENPFELEQREYPVEIPYPFQQQLVLNIKVPAGYAVEDLPESANMVLPSQGGKLLFSVTEKNGNIQLNSRIQLDQIVFTPQEYPALKTFFDLIIEKQGEQIVLKKSL